MFYNAILAPPCPAWAAGGLETGYGSGLLPDGPVRAPRLYRPGRLEFTFSVSETGLSVGGGDVGVESLVDPVALAEEVELAPSTRNWAELSMPRQCAQQRLGLGTPRRLGAVQHVDGVVPPPSDT
jgi:hypothetical protein